MTFVPWNGLLGGTVAMGSPVAVAMGALLIGLLVATTFALVLGAEWKPEKEALLLTALGHAGDCGAIVDDLSPAVLLLTNLCARNPDELYPPAAVLEYVSDRWTPELGVNVLRRTISDASERSPRTWS